MARPGERSRPELRYDGGAAVQAGLVAGTAFLLLRMALSPLALAESPWRPLRLAASLVTGRSALDEGHLSAIVAIGAFVHFAVSVTFACVIALAVSRVRGRIPAVFVGAGVGLATYFVHLHVLTIVFPWVADARGIASLFAHLIWGLVAGEVYETLAAEHRRMRAAGMTT